MDFELTITDRDGLTVKCPLCGKSETYSEMGTVDCVVSFVREHDFRCNKPGEKCDRCGSPFTEACIAGGRCTNCGTMITQRYSKDYSGPCPDDACSGACVNGECSHCGTGWLEKTGGFQADVTDDAQKRFDNYRKRGGKIEPKG